MVLEYLGDELDFVGVVADEHLAKLVLCRSPGAMIESLTGTLYGPVCRYSHTLPAEFRIDTGIQSGPWDIFVPISMFVLQPCYWTPQLPFLYTLYLELVFQKGNTKSFSQSVGMRRWRVEGNDFTLEGRRTVLRGGAFPNADVDRLQVAHEFDAALLISERTEEEMLYLADSLGVMVIVDAREHENKSELLARLAWHPSIALILLDQCQPEWRQRFPTLRTAQLVSPGEETVEPWADAVIVELAADETLPALPNWSRPTIALRRGVSYTGVEEARRACERMQAELAPQSLSGYLVAP